MQPGSREKSEQGGLDEIWYNVFNTNIYNFLSFGKCLVICRRVTQYLITICLLGLELKYFTSLLLLQLKVLTKAVHVQNHEKPNFYVATCYICTIIKLIQDICSDRFVAIWLHCSAKEEERPVSKPERFHLGLGQAIKMTASIWSKFKSRWIESKQTLIWVFGLL